jgi:hypothetical protein
MKNPPKKKLLFEKIIQESGADRVKLIREMFPNCLNPGVQYRLLLSGKRLISERELRVFSEGTNINLIEYEMPKHLDKVIKSRLELPWSPKYSKGTLYFTRGGYTATLSHIGFRLLVYKGDELIYSRKPTKRQTATKISTFIIRLNKIVKDYEDRI